jgi:hypothetical protein
MHREYSKQLNDQRLRVLTAREDAIQVGKKLDILLAYLKTGYSTFWRRSGKILQSHTSCGTIIRYRVQNGVES